MSDFIAALSMYDWPEQRAEVDALWMTIRDRLRAAGVDAPEDLTRDFADIHALWRQPNLLLAQTCWGPMEQGLSCYVQVVGQPSYDGIDGGQSELYSSAIVMRVLPSPQGGGSTRSVGVGVYAEDKDTSPPPRLASFASLQTLVDPPHKREGEGAVLPLHLLRNTRFAYNSLDSMSGIIALSRDLQAMGESLSIFSDQIETGGHRNSIVAVAEGRADVATIDCRSWALAQQYEPAAQKLQVVGWTARRKGLPFIMAKATPDDVVAKLRAAVTGL